MSFPCKTTLFMWPPFIPRIPVVNTLKAMVGTHSPATKYAACWTTRAGSSTRIFHQVKRLCPKGLRRIGITICREGPKTHVLKALTGRDLRFGPAYKSGLGLEVVVTQRIDVLLPVTCSLWCIILA